jgi:hypothetical protein
MDDIKELTLQELQHIMMSMNSFNGSENCGTCQSVRKKLEEIILTMQNEQLSGDRPVPEWMKKLGVTRIEVEKANNNQQIQEECKDESH